MKTLITCLAAFALAGPAFAEDLKSSKEQPAQTLTEGAKKSRKKKVEMCAECGKPESECECHGQKKKDEPKKEKSS